MSTRGVERSEGYAEGYQAALMDLADQIAEGGMEAALRWIGENKRVNR